MSPVRLKSTREQFHRFQSRRVQQGEVVAGRTPMATILGSCVCVGFHHAGKGVGALSHITGSGSRAGAHRPADALDALETALLEEGVDARECECFVIGGCDGQRHVYEHTIRALLQRGLRFTELDVLGTCHRKLVFDPASGEATLYKAASLHQPREDEHARFQDPKRRVTTGATTFFRNTALLESLRGEILPALLGEKNRLHVWCAGCSVGMEVYSIAMVVLDWLEAKGTQADFKILGTDISGEALATARAGVYPVAAQRRDRNAALLERYTETLPNRQVRVKPEVRGTTVFKQRDIGLGSRRHRFEVVVCDHVLQYFPETEQYRLVGAITKALAPGGYLYVSTPSPAVVEAIPKRFGLEKRAHHTYRMPRR